METERGWWRRRRRLMRLFERLSSKLRWFPISRLPKRGLIWAVIWRRCGWDERCFLSIMKNICWFVMDLIELLHFLFFFFWLPSSPPPLDPSCLFLFLPRPDTKTEPINQNWIVRPIAISSVPSCRRFQMYCLKKLFLHFFVMKWNLLIELLLNGHHNADDYGWFGRFLVRLYAMRYGYCLASFSQKRFHLFRTRFSSSAIGFLLLGFHVPTIFSWNCCWRDLQKSNNNRLKSFSFISLGFILMEFSNCRYSNSHRVFRSFLRIQSIGKWSLSASRASNNSHTKRPLNTYGIRSRSNRNEVLSWIAFDWVWRSSDEVETQVLGQVNWRCSLTIWRYGLKLFIFSYEDRTRRKTQEGKTAWFYSKLHSIVPPSSRN